MFEPRLDSIHVQRQSKCWSETLFYAFLSFAFTTTTTMSHRWENYKLINSVLMAIRAMGKRWPQDVDPVTKDDIVQRLVPCLVSIFFVFCFKEITVTYRICQSTHLSSFPQDFDLLGRARYVATVAAEVYVREPARDWWMFPPGSLCPWSLVCPVAVFSAYVDFKRPTG